MKITYQSFTIPQKKLLVFMHQFVRIFVTFYDNVLYKLQYDWVLIRK